MLTARFFRLRGFLAGVVGRWSSNMGGSSGSVCARLSNLKRELSLVAADSGEMLDEAGVSGDVLGDDSVIEAESTVEMVVVGDDSGESDAEVDVLSRGWWKRAKVWVIGLEHDSVEGRSRSGHSSEDLAASSSYTDMKDGMRAAKERCCGSMLGRGDASRLAGSVEAGSAAARSG